MSHDLEREAILDEAVEVLNPDVDGVIHCHRNEVWNAMASLIDKCLEARGNDLAFFLRGLAMDLTPIVEADRQRTLYTVMWEGMRETLKKAAYAAQYGVMADPVKGGIHERRSTSTPPLNVPVTGPPVCSSYGKVIDGVCPDIHCPEHGTLERR